MDDLDPGPPEAAAAAAAAAGAAALVATLRSGDAAVIHFAGGDGAFDAAWTAEERWSVLDAAQTNASVNAAVVDVAGMSGPQVDGVACLLGRLQEVRALEVLQSARTWPCGQIRIVADALLRGILRARLPSATPITKLALVAHCSPQVLLDFADRFPGIACLEVAGHCSGCWDATCAGHGNFATSIAVAIGRLANLREVRLHCDAPSMVTICLVHALNTSASVRVLGLRIAHGRRDFWRCVSLFCGSATSVNTVQLTSCTDTPVEVSGLFEAGVRQAFSPSIKELKFHLCWLDLRNDTFNDTFKKAVAALQNVESLRFYKCVIPMAFDILLHLPYLKKISSLSRSSSLRADHTLEDEFDEKPCMLGTNEQLERLCRVVEKGSLEEVVLDLVGQTETSTHDDESFPAVARLLRGSRGTLVLNLGNLPWMGSEHIASGVKDLGTHLKDLRLRCFRCGFGDADYAEILRPLAANATLTSFELGFDPEADLGTRERSIASIRDLLLVNTALEALSIRGLDADAAESLLDVVVPVLATTNRSLRALEMRDFDLTERWPTISGAILAMLRTNGVLCTIRKCLFPPDDPEAVQVKFLLKQNRYGRRFLLQPDLVRARGMWALILGKVSAAEEPAVMFAFLRGQPRLLCPFLEE